MRYIEYVEYTIHMREEFMGNLTLNLDKTAEKTIERLKNHYQAGSKAEVIRKALTLLDITREIEETKGQLLARQGDKETRIIIR